MIDNNTCAIIVTYNSNPIRLEKSISLLELQSFIIVCDNSTDIKVKLEIQEITKKFDIKYINMQGNQGIAKAQNYGLDVAATLNYRFVFFLDDDSIPESGIIKDIIDIYDRLVLRGHKVAAVGASARDINGKDISNALAKDSAVVPCTQMMSSGVLIPLNVIKVVGPMNDSLFIDCVDFDWGWRALSLGYEIFLAKALSFEHSLGQQYIKIGRLRFGVPSPIRHYYQYRNILFMMSKSYVPLSWKIRQICSLFFKLVLFTIFISPRLKRLNYMINGITDWAQNVTGKIQR